MIKKIALVIFLVFVYSWEDFCFPSDWNEECSGLIDISSITESPMGRTNIYVWVDPTIPGTDSDCANFAWCIRKLFDIYPAVLRVEILNPEHEWVPSLWRSIDLCHARLLNEPWEEYGEYASGDDFLADCYEVQYPDKIDLVWHD
jgi:hypothetical protein